MRFFLCAFSLAAALTLSAQDTGVPAPPPPQSGTVIKSEKRLVLVDAIVADKHGNYVRDLTVKDFRVWEDKKEQNVESFSFESGGNDLPSKPTREEGVCKKSFVAKTVSAE